jgi:soluble lytic murein transglycosylase
LRRARRALNRSARFELARVADLLGDPGVAYALGGRRKQPRPRAYAGEVEAAANRQGLDPNLLFAVMRVESIFHRRIVSRAGAVGLMQIMPRTGALIAERLGRRNFSILDLLEPAVSLEFSAWYLRSLLKRFQGRLPLAIAAYNGGPHNVYLWLRSSSRNMPLDSFLERIPLRETHRYVRRVLTHYAAYRTQQGLPMVELPVDLPETRPDEVAF